MKQTICFFAVMLGVVMFSVAGVQASTPKGIPWYEGSVEDAFEEAKKTNKPLFLIALFSVEQKR